MQPIAIELGPFPIHWYGVMVALGFVAGLWTARRRGLASGISAEKVIDFGPWIILGAIIGARTLYVISYWRESFEGRPTWEIFAVWQGGLVFYGGLMGSTVASAIYIRLKKLPFWKMADILAPSIALGYVFGRIGCLLNGCCYGRACDLPWAIHFPGGNALNAPTTPLRYLLLHGKYEDFFVLEDEAEKMNRTSPDAWFRRMMARVLAGDFEAARQEIVQTVPGGGTASLSLAYATGLLSELTHSPSEARPAYEAALVLARSPGERCAVLKQIGRFEAGLGNQAKAKAAWKAAGEADPEDPEARILATKAP